MDNIYKILFLEDSRSDVESMKAELELAGVKFVAHQVDDENGFLTAINDFKPDIVFSDYTLNDYNGIESFRHLKQNKFRPAFIIVTSSLKEKLASVCFSEGIDDFVFKWNYRSIPSAFFKAIEKRRSEMHHDKIMLDVLKRNKELEQFAYIISHNLSGSVANIQGLFNLWDPQNRTEKEQRFIHTGIERSIQKLDEVIKDMNDILRVKNEANEGKQVVKFENLVKDIKVSIYTAVQNSKAKIKFDFSEVESLVTNKSYMYSIFYNLIVNSIKYKKEKDTPDILIKSRFVSEGIELVFKDNGTGIDLEKHGGKIFGLYKRFSEKQDGKGMGLFLVKNQVESLMGTIEVKSKIDEGTEFIIKLPVS